MQAMLAENQEVMAPEVLAVAARYPTASQDQTPGLDSFWAAACAGQDLPAVVPLARWDIDSCYSPQLAPGKM